MKFVFKEVSQNNEKQVAVFRSEDQSCEVFITGTNLSDFSQFKAGQSYITITSIEAVAEVEEQPDSGLRV